MNLLFVADPLSSFKIYKDTTFAMMREAQRCGHTISVCEVRDLMWQRGGTVTAYVRDITLTGDPVRWYSEAQQAPDERLQALKVGEVGQLQLRQIGRAAVGIGRLDHAGVVKADAGQLACGVAVLLERRHAESGRVAIGLHAWRSGQLVE